MQAGPKPLAQRRWNALSRRGRQLQLGEARHALQNGQILWCQLQLRVASQQQAPQGGG